MNIENLTKRELRQYVQEYIEEYPEYRDAAEWLLNDSSSFMFEKWLDDRIKEKKERRGAV